MPTLLMQLKDGHRVRLLNIGELVAWETEYEHWTFSYEHWNVSVVRTGL